MTDDPGRLQDVLEAIDGIKRYADRTRAGFDADELVQAWMVRQLQIIGEALSGVSDELREANPQVPWREIVGMRNRLVHAYRYIDLDVVWSAVTQGVPELEPQVRRMLEELE